MALELRASLAAAALLVAGCSPSAPPAADGAWTMQVSATAGSALVWKEAGKEALRIACRRNPADLLASTPKLAGRPGPVRLRIGDASFDLQSEGEAPLLSATGPIPQDLPAALVSSQAMSLQQDGQSVTSARAPDPALAQAFAKACR